MNTSSTSTLELCVIRGTGTGRPAPSRARRRWNRAGTFSSPSGVAVTDAAPTAARKACELRDWKEPSDWKALAATYAESRDFANAVRWQRKVVAAVEDDEREEEQNILELYQENHPYRVAPGS